jgi:hypothetical protein
MRATTDVQSAPAAISSKSPARSGAVSATAMVMISSRMNRIARVAIGRPMPEMTAAAPAKSSTTISLSQP